MLRHYENLLASGADLRGSRILNEFAVEAGVKLISLQNRLMEFRREVTAIYDNTSLGVPNLEPRPYDDFMVVESDNATISSDWEFPETNLAFLEAMLLSSIQRRSKKLYMLGDMLALDNPSFSRWAVRWRTGDEKPFRIVMRYVNDVLNRMLDWYDEIKVISSNHDDRLALATGGELDLGMFFNNPKVEFSMYPYMYIRTSNHGIIKGIHPQNYSQNPVTMGKDFYAQEVGPDYDPKRPFTTVQKTHIVMAHCHIAQTSSSPDGVYQIMSLGTMRNPLLVQYLRTAANRIRKWDNAFARLDEGQLSLMPYLGYDWRRELGPKHYNRLFVDEYRFDEYNRNLRQLTSNGELQ